MTDEPGDSPSRSETAAEITPVLPKPRLENPPSDLAPFFQTLHDYSDRFDWTEMFGNDNPVEIDVGCGRGLFVYNASQANPDINYLGIEIDYKEGRRAAKRLQKAEIPNARVIGGDVHKAFLNFIHPKSVAAIHLYFPDPWWKAKHHKRRVFNEQFMEFAEQVMIPQALLHVWTDVTDYWKMVREMLETLPQFQELEPPAERTPEHDMDYQTSFERKKRKDGWPIYRGLWQLK